MQRRKPTGGFLKPVQWGLWIRDELADGHSTWGYQLYSAYAKHVRSFPLYGKGNRRVASYRSFTTYLYVLRTLGLIEYDRDSSGAIVTAEAHGKDGLPTPDLAPQHHFHAVLNRLNDQAWGDPWFVYLGYKPGRKP